VANGFDIITGKDMLEERRRIMSGSAQLTKGELDQNAGSLGKWISEHIPNDVGFVLVLVPKDSDEIGSTASPRDYSYERTARILEKAARRVRKSGK
jgi:hypothetical protein